MNNLQAIRSVIAATLFALSAASLAAIQLVPVVSSGLSSPIFAGHAGDGSNRLFIVERGGVIRVLQPGASAPTEFLDIHTKVLAGGERGLLGLAFHPQYAANGRFFVFYTRAVDGTLVIAEFLVSADRNVASTTETVLLTIPHPNTNHNGGMLAFGPDGYLYIGVGDGGSSNDPLKNAQNIEVLLGKILRIDVDGGDSVAGTPYSSPADNPYAGTAGRDEIFSIGWRNPWRFSFDRLTDQQWVADVGQGTREEVDTPIVKGGNYGWRVYEGTGCTNNDPTLCVSANYLPPVFDYGHSGGRCSITGGYVYRGGQAALPVGTYVYGDYCSGEIFAWDGATQTVLLDTTLNISSFGEDEQGELYVVNLGGTVSRIASACTFGITPSSQSFGASGGSNNVGVTAGAGCDWTAAANAPWIHVTSGSAGSGNGSVAYSVDANTSTSARNSTLTIAGKTFTVDQSGAAPCVVTISPTSATYSRGAGGGSVAVTTATGCSWTAVSNASWITIVGAASGSGNATVTYSVAAYTGKPKKRTGTVTIGGRSFSVTQTK
jgi:glucose/arabinose dehydrogenase